MVLCLVQEKTQEYHFVTITEQCNCVNKMKKDVDNTVLTDIIK